MCTLLCGTIKISNKILNHSFKITCRCCRSLLISSQYHFPIKHACKRRRPLRTWWTIPSTSLSGDSLPFHTKQDKQVNVIHFMTYNSGCTLICMIIQQAASFTKHSWTARRMYLHVHVRMYLSRQMVSAKYYKSHDHIPVKHGQNSYTSPFIPENIIIRNWWLEK